jgi:Spy/CpxP family protein refolding chaperone
MRAFLTATVGLGLVALLAGPAAAQGRGGFGMFGGGGGYAMLLSNESVQKELKLEDQQVEKAKELGEKAREKMTAARSSFEGLDQEERRTKMTELMREVNESTMKSAGEFLKPEQVTRLKQISYQQRGATAFNDPEVQKKLNITDSQKTDIHAIVQESQTEMRTIFQENQDDREAMMKKITEHRKQTLAKVEAKLNDEQQKSWKEMLGSPFEIKIPPRPNN